MPHAISRASAVQWVHQRYNCGRIRWGIAQLALTPFGLFGEVRFPAIVMSWQRWGYVQGRGGNIDAAHEALNESNRLEETSFVSAFDRALIFLGLGDVERALEWLEKARDERSYWLIYVNSDRYWIL